MLLFMHASVFAMVHVHMHACLHAMLCATVPLVHAALQAVCHATMCAVFHDSTHEGFCAMVCTAVHAMVHRVA